MINTSTGVKTCYRCANGGLPSGVDAKGDAICPEPVTTGGGSGETNEERLRRVAQNREDRRNAGRANQQAVVNELAINESSIEDIFKDPALRRQFIAKFSV